MQRYYFRKYNRINKELKVQYAKSEFGITLARVTGLDAAGPLFEKTTKEVRIDKSDATYVDLIHTNGGNEDQGFLGKRLSSF